MTCEAPPGRTTEISGNKVNKLTESVDSEDASVNAEIIEMKRLAGI